MPRHQLPSSRLAGAGAAAMLALAMLPGVAGAVPVDGGSVQDAAPTVVMPSPDTRDSVRDLTPTVVMPSPDTRDSLRDLTPGVDLRSPDTRDAASPGQARGVVATAATGSAPSATADTATGTDWEAVITAAGAGAAVLLIAGGVALVATGGQSPAGRGRFPLAPR